SESEKLVQEALDDLFVEQKKNGVGNHSMSILVSGHRLSAVKNADEILVMQSGRIVEVGTHK
ncbi:unnamed protein product, partial [Heterosigma akashiwo]